MPLVRVDRFGWWPHDLWADHLDDAFAEVLSLSEREKAQATAAAEYLRRADYVAAYRLARAAGDEAMWRSVVNTAFGVLPPRVGRDVMLRWAADLATAAPGSAEQLYLDGKRAADERDSPRALERFLRARALAEAAGDHHAERNVIVDLAVVGLAVDRIDVVASLLPRAVALADEGLPEGITMQTMGKAMIEEISGNIEAAIAHHRSVVEPPGTWLANMAHYNAGRMLFMLGRLDEAWAESERFVNPSRDLSLLATQADIRLAVLWARGDLEGFEAIIGVCTDFARTPRVPAAVGFALAEAGDSRGPPREGRSPLPPPPVPRLDLVHRRRTVARTGPAASRRWRRTRRCGSPRRARHAYRRDERIDIRPARRRGPHHYDFGPRGFRRCR